MSSVTWNTHESLYSSAGRTKENGSKLERKKLSHTASSAINRNSVKIEIHQHNLKHQSQRKKWDSDRVCKSNKNTKSAKTSNFNVGSAEEKKNRSKKKWNKVYREPVFNFPQNYLQYKSELVWTNIIKVFYMNPNICAAHSCRCCAAFSTSCVLLQIFSHYSWLHFLLSTLSIVHWATSIWLKPCLAWACGVLCLTQPSIQWIQSYSYAISLYVIALWAPFLSLPLFLPVRMIRWNDAESATSNSSLRFTLFTFWWCKTFAGFSNNVLFEIYSWPQPTSQNVHTHPLTPVVKWDFVSVRIV